MPQLEILFYSPGAGDPPFRKWLLELKDVQARVRIWTRIRRLALGHFGDMKNVGEGVCELRLFFGPGYRIYFSLVDSTRIIFLWAGTKDSQEKDIKRAHAYWAKFRRSQ